MPRRAGGPAAGRGRPNPVSDLGWQADCKRVSPSCQRLPGSASRVRGPGERAAVSDWLHAAGIEPVLLVDACFVNADVPGADSTAVVADAGLLTPQFLAGLRRGDPGKPVLAVGDTEDPTQRVLARKDVSFHRPAARRARPGAGRVAGGGRGPPLRRSERRVVPRLATTIEGEPAVLLDVSTEGCGSKMRERRRRRSCRRSSWCTCPCSSWACRCSAYGSDRRSARPAPRCSAARRCSSSDERTLRAWQRLRRPGAPACSSRPGRRRHQRRPTGSSTASRRCWPTRRSSGRSRTCPGAAAR